ncbi:MAG: NAD(P)/FAD-dependent oxidoreductase [Rhodospirillales bacterium]|jgi:L-2-hydroxyglutarate oxidase LhgO|nr:NAD(P)/FAD-dependent oxidoreductase [Rhodospirillales bacterium]
MTESIQCAVIGAGAIGLAIAREMAMRGIEVIVLEESDAIGSDTSSRNSEVVHAGIYYPTDTLKAKLCVEGRDQLYEYFESHGVGYDRCGKLIVATDDAQIGRLEAIKAKAEANGVSDLQWLDGAQAVAMEPNLKAKAALFSPSSGIMDSHRLMLAYQGDLEDNGGMVAFLSPVWGGRLENGAKVISVHGDEPMDLACDIIINSAGLGAQALSTSLEFLPQDTIPARYLAKGTYFTLTGRAPFSRLVYPIPEDGGLGVHLSLDLGGQARFGPDVEWIDEIDYDVDPARADIFYSAIRTYWADLEDGALQPGYTGVRPKVSPQGAPDADFVIQGPETHGVAGLVNLYGMESPGLTASIAIARHVADMLK